MEDSKCDKEKIKKIKSIIEKEIEKELTSKQNEVADISEKIKIILRNLELLKYIVAVNYYEQNVTLTPKKGQEDENEEEKTQTQIHPCIKKLMPFRSNYNKSFGDVSLSHSYETRNSKKTNCNEANFIEIKKEVGDNSNQENNNTKLPQYIPPLPNENKNIGIINSMRGSVSKELFRIIVGNVSKWIPPDTREDNSTHKWMVYIRNKDSSKDVTKLIKKVRYFLHESYKPHDIIDVTSPPFHLTRRGWGEFPVRVQLHFSHPLNKPVDIIHNLKLDATCSGIQMLGAETSVEALLHPSNSSLSAKNEAKFGSYLESQFIGEKCVKEKQDVYDSSLLTTINGIKPINEIKTEPENDIIIKQEPEVLQNGNNYDCKMEATISAINNSRKFLLDRRKTIKVIEIEHNYLKRTNIEINDQSDDCSNMIFKLETMRTQNGVDKTCKNGAVLETGFVNQIINRKNQVLLNKIEIPSSRSEKEIFLSLKSMVNKLETENQSKYCMKIFRNMYLINIIQRAKATKLTNVESLIKWFVQRWPIITKLSLDPTYKTVHPYSSPTEEEFFKYNIGKQRSAEWFRAKAIQKALTSLKSMVPLEEEIWSTKQILLWSRFHGYSPSSFQKISTKELTETNELGNKRLKNNDSSSDSDGETYDKSNKKFKVDEEKYLNGLNVSERKRNFKKSRRKDLSEEILDRRKNYKEFNTWSEATDPQRFGVNDFRVLQSDWSEHEIEVVEVENKKEIESPTSKKNVAVSVVTTPSNEVLFNKFVCDTVKQIGIKIVDEETVPGVKSDSVSRVMSQCVSSFLEELLRRSFAQAWLRNGDRCPDSVKMSDVLATILECQRFDIFTNRGLGMPNPEKS